MRASSRIAVLVFFGAVALWFAVQLGLTITGLRITNEDDIFVAQAAADPAAAADNRGFDYAMGRIYVGVKFAILEAVMRVRPDGLQAAVRVALMLPAAGAAAWFTWVWRRNRREALLVLVAIVGLFQISVSYQALMSQQTFWLGWTAVWLLGAFALQADSAANRAGILVAFAAALACHESNAAFLPWAVALRLVPQGGERPRVALRPFWACAVVLAVFAGLALSVRQQGSGAPPLYTGTTLSPDLGRFALALNVFSLGSFPGLESWRVRWTDTPHPLWLTPAQWLEQWRAWITWTGVGGAGLLGLAVWLGLARDGEEGAGAAGWEGSPRRHPVALLALLVAAAYAPNLLLAATLKYQGWAQQRMWPYYYSAMSYLVWIVVLVTGANLLLAKLRRPAWRAAGRAVAAMLAAVLALSVAGSSREAAAHLRREPLHHIKFYPHGPGK
ncbi:MAG: hypothetical protein HY302_02090 [Opitutae bacterium]|nr:hypothetical protein [Opitutae bacterium]